MTGSPHPPQILRNARKPLHKNCPSNRSSAPFQPQAAASHCAGSTTRNRFLLSALLALSLAGCLAATPPDSPAPGLAESQKSAISAGELWHIPSPIPGLMMRATLFRPPGEGPFPLAVINHGSDQDPVVRARMKMPEFQALTDWFLRHGYAVLLPQRPGHGATGGRYIEDQGLCIRPDYVRSGQRTADSIAASINFMAAQPFVRPDGIVVVGHSAGGWGALALAGRNPSGVSAIINMSGGRGGHNRGRADNNCAPDRLVAAARQFGQTARVPTLWLYAGNDTYFPPDLSRRMAEAFVAAGGAAEYHLLSPLAGEGHALAGTEAAWSSQLAAFLAAH